MGLVAQAKTRYGGRRKIHDNVRTRHSLREGDPRRHLAPRFVLQRRARSGGQGERRPQSGRRKKIALLLPESKTARYESKDRPFFEAKVKALCPDCQILASNANQDAAQQQAQAEAALTNGARVLVLDPVDSASATAIAMKAKAQKVPVIAYDRLIPGTDAIDYYVSFDNEAVGRLQAEALLKALAGKAEPRIVMINGAATDNNGALFKKGAHSVLDGKVKVLKEYDTPDWSPDKAQDEMTQALTAIGDYLDGCVRRQRWNGGRSHRGDEGGRHPRPCLLSPAKTPSSPPCRGSSWGSSR